MFNKLFSKVFLFVLTTASVATSATAGIKIAKGLGAPVSRTNGIAVQSVSASDDISPTITPVPDPSDSPISPVPSRKPTPTFRLSVSATPRITQTFSSPIPASNSNCNPPPSNLCIVTLFGQQFDVTSLRSSHSGGDIFVCGSDMTARYQSQHGSSLGRMQSYIYTPASCTSTATNTGTPTKPQPTGVPIYHEIKDEIQKDGLDEHKEDTKIETEKND